MGLMFRVAVLRATCRAELCGFRCADTELEKPYPDPETGKERMGALFAVERPTLHLERLPSLPSVTVHVPRRCSCRIGAIGTGFLPEGLLHTEHAVPRLCRYMTGPTAPV